MDWTRARRIRQEIQYACHRGLDSLALAHEVRRLVGTVVPFDLSCWHPTDPSTGLLAGGIFEIPPTLTARLSEIEFFENDFNSLAELAGRRRPVGILRDETSGQPQRSARYREILRPLGLEEELRAVFVTHSGPWAAAGLFRQRGARPFNAEEARFITEITRMVAEGFRNALLVSTVGTEQPLDAPGIVLFGQDGTVLDISPAAARWLAELGGDTGDGPTTLPIQVEQVAAAARAPSQRGSFDKGTRARVLTKSGRWLVLHGTRFSGGDNTAVIIEAAAPAVVAPLIVEAYGLSDREQQIVPLVIRGASTKQIANVLSLSPLTVQDHLKTIFEKMAIRSRRQIAGKIFFDHYFPALFGNKP
ncbi:MAG: helix-turn-helix transcriptional regulator [Pseudonocardiales bacterium]|nr:helix-turn-helix transcriptional regulator [Pseudonocardiales bacterium]